MDLSKLFDQFNTQDSYAILFIMLIAFFLLLATSFAAASDTTKARTEGKKRLAESLYQKRWRSKLGLKEADLKRQALHSRRRRPKQSALRDEKGITLRKLTSTGSSTSCIY